MGLVRQHLLGDRLTVHAGGIEGRPVLDLFQQGLAIVAPVQVVMMGIAGGDRVIAELDERRQRLSAGFAFEDIADPAIAGRLCYPSDADLSTMAN